MADRGDDGGEHKRPKPPAVPPVVPPAVPPAVKPVVPPAVRPVVPPAVPPVARPVVPPAVPPAVPRAVPPTVPPAVPVARPVVPPSVPQRPVAPAVPPSVPPTVPPAVPPSVPPVVPPVAAPVVSPAAPPPVMKPLAPPPPAPPPPVMKPVSAPEPQAPSRRESRRDRGPEEEAPKGRGRDRESSGGRGGSVPPSGMGIGAKVAMVTLFATMAVVALAVLPAMKPGGGDEDPSAAFEAAGFRSARLVAAALSDTGPVSTGKPAWTKSMDAFLGDVDKQVSGLRVENAVKDRLTRALGVLKAMASDPSGRAAQKAVEDLLTWVNDQLRALKSEEDEEKRKPLQDQRDALTAFKAALASAGDGGPSPSAPSGSAKLDRFRVGPEFPLLAVWFTSPKGDTVVAQSPSNVPLPAVPGDALQRAQSKWDVPWQGGTATVFTVPVTNSANQKTGQVLVAAPTPVGAAGPKASGNPIGLAMIFVGSALVAVLAWVVASQHSKPLKDLARELDRLGSTGDPGRRIAARGGEATAIARSVEKMVSTLKFRDQHAMADLEGIIAKEQETASSIHQGLMPKDPPRIPGWEVETLFKPGFEIGGDHFDYFRIDDTHLGVILMDTSVRGIPAALVMAMAHAYVRSEAPGVLSPSEVLMKVNRLLAADLPAGQYVTALYVVIDVASGTAKVASAGHLPLVVYRHAQGKTAIVNPEGVALGLDVGPVFDRALTEVEVPIGVGDRLVLHTDGAMKVTNDVGEEFGERRLYEEIRTKAPMNSQAFVNFVGSAIDAYHLNTQQNDDITISTVKRLK